jgi:hypothetical protein
MKDEIRRYLDEHGATYTPDALRGKLLEAGYEPADIDAALRQWAGERARAGGGERARESFRLWSLLIYLGAMVAVFLLTILMNGTESVGVALIGLAVLAFFLLVGWAVSALLGRWIVPRAGLGVALVVPLVFALGLGGTCLAIMDGLTPPRPAQGTVELRIDPPLGLAGSGAADCFIELDGRASSIYAQNLGPLDGRTVELSVNGFQVISNPSATQEPVTGPDAPSLYIALHPASEAEPGSSFTSTVDSRLEFQNAADGRSGTVTFQNLAPEPVGEPGAEQPEIGDPISGTITWTCEVRP